MTLKEQILKKVENRPAEWRYGQAVFNYAYELYPNEVNQLRFSHYDCFYNDKLVNDFIDKLENILSKSI